MFIKLDDTVILNTDLVQEVYLDQDASSIIVTWTDKSKTEYRYILQEAAKETFDALAFRLEGICNV